MLRRVGQFDSIALLLLLSIFLAACGDSQSAILYYTGTPIIVPSHQEASALLGGGAIWIHDCQMGWQAYQAHPTYRDQHGVERPKDVYLYGHFWIQPPDGSLWNYIQNKRPDKEQCIEHVLQAAHQNQSKVYGVLGIDEDPGNWTRSDIIPYIQRAARDSHVLQPIIDQVHRYQYDGLVNDIETGDDNNPTAFADFNKNLRQMLHDENPQALLGTTLIAKTTDLSTPWQSWRSLANGAVDFFVMMAFDHDTIYSDPSSIVDTQWLKHIYAYLKSIPHMLEYPMEWELPTYCRLWQLNNGWSNQTCEYPDAFKLVKGLLSGSNGTILSNHALALDNPYIHYTDSNGIESYLYYETVPSLINQTHVLQSLQGGQCLYLSFWDDDTGEPQVLWPSLQQDQQIKLC